MYQDFSITAKQVKKVFSKSELKPREDIIIRTASKEIVDDSFNGEGPWSKEKVKRTLDKPDYFLVATFYKGVPIGYMILYEGWYKDVSKKKVDALCLIRVFTMPNCRLHGVGMAQLIAFLCMAKSMDSGIVIQLPKDSRSGILEMLGLADKFRCDSLFCRISEIGKDLKEKGFDLSKYRKGV